MERSREFIPNVLNYRHLLFGLSYETIVGILMVFAISSIISKFSLEASALIMILALPALVIMGRREDTMTAILSEMSFRFRKKQKNVIINENIGREEFIYVRNENHLASLFIISGSNLHSRSLAEINGVYTRMSLALNQIVSDLTVISIPVEKQHDALITDSGHDADIEGEYASLLNYALSGVYYQSIYILLKRRINGNNSESDLSSLGEETKSFMNNLTANGFNCRNPAENEVREILEFID
ncbi:MAG: hypothetical protein ACP5NK_04785 [Thermoplasmata archaeon]